MNMAARMESTGARNRVHISSDTAELLKAAGKGGWIEKRKETIDVKGKGLLHTYWVKVTTESSSSACSSSLHEGADALPAIQAKRKLKDSKSQENQIAQKVPLTTNTVADKKIERLVDWNVSVLMQRLQAIQSTRHKGEPIDPKVTTQLKQHVQGIAYMYRKNPFHNFEVSYLCWSNSYYFYTCQSSSHFVIASFLPFPACVSCDNELHENA
jgi:hypothetical protein